MRVLLAPDKFKGTLSGAQVAAHLAAGMRAAQPSLEVVELPVADGGDGTVDAAVAGGFTRVGDYARRGDTAVVELAAVCGLGRSPDGARTPMTASSSGSATCCGPRWRRRAAGRPRRRRQREHRRRGRNAQRARRPSAGRGRRRGGAGRRGLADVAALDLTELDPAVRAAEIVLASDVDNPLYGPSGAAASTRRRRARARTRCTRSTRRCAVGPKSWPRRSAAITPGRRGRRGRRGRVRRARGAGRRRGGRGSRSSSNCSASSSNSSAATSSSPARARSTSRPSPARRRPGSPPRPERPASRSSRSAGTTSSRTRRGSTRSTPHRPRFAHRRHGATGPAAGTDRRRHRAHLAASLGNGPLRAGSGRGVREGKRE